MPSSGLFHKRAPKKKSSATPTQNISTRRCRDCDGTGFQLRRLPSPGFGDGYSTFAKRCSACGGKGKVAGGGVTALPPCPHDFKSAAAGDRDLPVSLEEVLA